MELSPFGTTRVSYWLFSKIQRQEEQLYKFTCRAAQGGGGMCEGPAGLTGLSTATLCGKACPKQHRLQQNPFLLIAPKHSKYFQRIECSKSKHD